VTIFEGARLLTGDGVVIDDAAFIVANDRFVGVGRRGQLPPPPGAVRVDLFRQDGDAGAGRRPRHMGLPQGHELLRRQLHARELSPTCSTATPSLVSLRSSRPAPGAGDLPYQVRAAAHSSTRYLTTGSGLGMPNAGPGGVMRDSAYGVTTEEEARRDVRELAAHKPDLIKIWSMTATARCRKLTPALYRAIIDEAHSTIFE